MYKQIKSSLEDKKIIEELIRGYEDRIKFKIQKELGLHATTFSEMKVECSMTNDDKFLKLFGQIERLDKELQTCREELRIIEDMLESIDKKLAECTEVEKKVFRCRYIWGLSRKQTAERLKYSEDRIKQIIKEIANK